MNHSELLRKSIESSELRVQDFAKAVGVARQTIYKWEKKGEIPERWRLRVASLSNGAIEASEFTTVFI